MVVVEYHEEKALNAFLAPESDLAKLSRQQPDRQRPGLAGEFFFKPAILDKRSSKVMSRPFVGQTKNIIRGNTETMRIFRTRLKA